MNGPSDSKFACHVTGAEKLPAESGGEAALCAAIKKALVEQKVAGSLSIEVTVRSPRLLAATVTRDGKRLPEMTMDVFDTAITKTIIDRFARSVAQFALSGS